MVPKKGWTTKSFPLNSSSAHSHDVQEGAAAAQEDAIPITIAGARQPGGSSQLEDACQGAHGQHAQKPTRWQLQELHDDEQEREAG